ncbi:hypothetical protein REPUB_Repub17cG0140700 [Reevesia pubescens]
MNEEMNGVDIENHQENVPEKIDSVFKVVVIGDSAVGKTQILSSPPLGLSFRPGLLILKAKSSKPRSGTLLAKKG